jgi:chlorophyll/bacteriochlorophyll a synthase
VLCAVMLLPQAVVVGLLRSWGAAGAAIGVTALVVVQIGLMARFLRAPRERALFLSAVGVPFYVSGMMVAAVALRSLA